MIPILAWRNVWRSRVRSWVVIGAVAVGVWALLFLLGFSQGMIASYIKSAIENQTSHLQVHSPQFLKDKEVSFFIKNSETVLMDLNKNPKVKNTALRTLSTGMIATAKGGRGVQIKGVEPKMEAEISQLMEKIKAGKYFDEESRNPILISEKMAEKLKTKLRKKVVLTFQTINGEPIQAAFKVRGIYSTGNASLDLGTVYVRNTDLNRLLGMENTGHEIAVLLKNIEDLPSFTASFNAAADTTKAIAQSYDAIAPELKLFNEQLSSTTGIMTFIIMFALIFGIINTMLMAVLERTKELGMLMAIGMNKGKVFLTICLETILLSSIGAPIGLFLGWLSVTLVHRSGLNLSMYQKGLDQFGMSAIVYPELATSTYFVVAIAVFFTAVLAAIYPAYKAIKLKPVEALRKI